MAIVYKHTSPNGKVYIGITTNEDCHRWGKNGNGYKNNKYFWRAIQKYGWSNFKHEILFNSISLKEAEQIEIKLIAKYNATDPKFGYNNAIGGATNKGYHHSEEYKENLRQSMLGKYAGEKSPCYGVSLSDEVKQRISESKSGKKQTEETKRKRSKSLQGHIVTEETRQKIKLSNIQNHVVTEEQRQKMRDAWNIRRTKEYKNSTKEKIRQANVGKRKLQETKNKISNTLKGIPKSEETKQKMRDAWKRRKAVVVNEFGK